eukprot:UN00370
MVSTCRFWKNLCCCFICFIVLVSILVVALIVNYTQRHSHKGYAEQYPEDAAYFVHASDVTGKTAMITGSCDETIVPTASTLIQNNITVILGCNDTETIPNYKQLNNTNTNQTNLLVKWRFNVSDLTCIDEFVAKFKWKYPSLNILINNGINFDYAHFYLIQKLTPLLSNTSGLSRIINIASKQASNHTNDTHIIFTNEYNKRHNNKSVYIYAVSLQRYVQSQMLTDVALMSDEQYLQFGDKYSQKWNKHNMYEKALGDKLGEKLWNLSAEMVKQRRFER